jgi:hypothetical protein
MNKERLSQVSPVSYLPDSFLILKKALNLKLKQDDAFRIS